MTVDYLDAKPEPHVCTASVGRIEPRLILHRWAWKLIVGVPAISIPIVFCPFCGNELPTRATESQ